MIHKSTTTITKGMILLERAPIDHNLELLNTRPRMAMRYKLSMNGKDRIITHMGPPSMEVIKVVMTTMTTVKCGSNDLHFCT